MGVRLRRGLEGHARAARRQGGERRRDDARARPRPRPRRVHDHHRGVRRLHARRIASRDGLDDQVAEALAPARGGGGKEVRRRRGSAAGVGPQRRARVDAGDARHDPERRPERRRRCAGLAGATDNDRFAWDSYRRLVQMFGNVVEGVPGSRFEDAIGRGQAGRRGRDRRPAARRLAEEARRGVQGLLRLPPGATGAAPPRDPRGVRLLDGRPGGLVPADQPHPRRLGHGGQRPADGVRQQGRRLRHRRRLQPRRGHRRAGAERRFPRQRPGRGRRLRRPHAARHLRARRGACPRRTSS